MSSAEKKTWTVLDLIDWTKGYFADKGIDSPRLDAELLLARVLGLDRMGLYLNFDRPLTQAELDAFRELVKQRGRRVPVKYLLGVCEFMSLEFEVGPGVLIPRPESEHLVERAAAILRERDCGEAALAYDVGAGTGCLAVALAEAAPGARVIASDISEEALAFARRNIERRGLADRVLLRRGDLLDAFASDEPADVILSNPPYVAESEWAGLQPEIVRYEPRVALVAGEDGLDCIRRLIADAPARLKPGGTLLCEIGDGQARRVEALAKQTGAYKHIAFIRDLAGVERVLEARVE